MLRQNRILTRAQAEASIASFGRHLARDFPAANAGSTWRTVPIDDSFVDKDGQPIIGMTAVEPERRRLIRDQIEADFARLPR
jgi:hypothetical protein